MSTIKFYIVISSAGRQAEALAGNSGPAKREIVADLAALTQHQRDVVVPLAHLNDNDGSLTLTIHDTLSWVVIKALRDEPNYNALGTERGTRPDHWIDKTAVQFDAMPDADQLIAEIERIQTANAAVLAQAEALAQPCAEKLAAEKLADAESQARHAAEYARMRPIMDALIAAEDYEAINVSNTGAAPVERPDWYAWSFSPARGQSLSDLQSDACAVLRRARIEAEKSRWIEAHGSEYLRRACIEHGYDCQKRYVIERAAIEAATYIVDWHDGAEWKSRSCPSETALDELEIAASLYLGVAEIVWLTAPAQPERSTDDEYEPFDPCEAVVIRGYLGKYDLVKVI